VEVASVCCHAFEREVDGGGGGGPFAGKVVVQVAIVCHCEGGKVVVVAAVTRLRGRSSS
jgi:hypothetical protein